METWSSLHPDPPVGRRVVLTEGAHFRGEGGTALVP